MVCEATFFGIQSVRESIGIHQYQKEKVKIILRMKQVLIADTQLMEIAEENEQPKGCNKKSKELEALRVVKEDTDE